MRVLLDEHVPWRFARSLEGHNVSTVGREGWAGTKNGELLRRAAAAGFEVLVTNDGSLEHQQNLAEVDLGIVLVGAPTNNLEDLVPRVDATRAAIEVVQPGEVRHISG